MTWVNRNAFLSDCILILIVVWTCKALVNISNMSCITATKDAVNMLIDTECAFGEARSELRNTRAHEICATSSFHNRRLGVSSIVAGRSSSIEAAFNIKMLAKTIAPHLHRRTAVESACLDYSFHNYTRALSYNVPFSQLLPQHKAFTGPNPNHNLRPITQQQHRFSDTPAQAFIIRRSNPSMMMPTGIPNTSMCR